MNMNPATIRGRCKDRMLASVWLTLLPAAIEIRLINIGSVEQVEFSVT